MEYVLCFIVLAISYNQGAARPANSDLEFITKNELSMSSEVSQRTADDGIAFLLPTNIRDGLVITIKGTLNTNKKTFTVVLPSTSGSEDCQIKYSFQEGTIFMTPADPDYESTSYSINLASTATPTFTLKLMARVNVEGEQTLGMVFNGNDDGESSHLMCKIKNFQDIDKIVMKEGLAEIHSLMFEFEQNH